MKEQKKIYGTPRSSKDALAGQDICFDYIRKHQLKKPCMKPVKIQSVRELD